MIPVTRFEPQGTASAEDRAYLRARKRVDELRRFYVNLAIYAVVNLALFLIDMSQPGGVWFVWPLGIWGAFLVVDGISLFLRRGPLGEEWAERKVRQQLEHDRARRRPQPPLPAG